MTDTTRELGVWVIEHDGETKFRVKDKDATEYGRQHPGVRMRFEVDGATIHSNGDRHETR